MAIRSFGSGLLFANGANGPVQFGTLQDVTLDFKGTTKKLYGQNQMPVAIGRGELALTGKAKMGQITGPIYNDLFFGGTKTTGTVKVVSDEAGSVPAATTYTITVANAANFAEDLGVRYKTTGVQLIQVAAGSEALGAYSVDAATGIYTFSAADASAAVKISYTYTDAANGNTYALGNPQQGVQPTFSMIVERSYNGVGERFKLWECISNNLQMPTKLADWGISEFDFECFADASDNTITVYEDE